MSEKTIPEGWIETTPQDFFRLSTEQHKESMLRMIMEDAQNCVRTHDEQTCDCGWCTKMQRYANWAEDALTWKPKIDLRGWEYTDGEHNLPDEGAKVFITDGRGIELAQHGGKYGSMKVAGWWMLHHITGKFVQRDKISHWHPMLEFPDKEE
jgi:hypothetical protein